MWLIWSIEHGAWWAPAHGGYVRNIEDAGQYSFVEALRIVEGANKYLGPDVPPNEAMIKADE